MTNNRGIPSPEERPDLYDDFDFDFDFDYTERPAGWVNPSKTPERIQCLIAKRKTAKDKAVKPDSDEEQKNS